jgi:flagellar basal body-associated protein FliL
VNEGSRKTALVIGAVVAAAGLAILSYYWIRAANSKDTKPLRSVKEVLDDCYTRMREIQDNLSELNPPVIYPTPSQG